MESAHADGGILPGGNQGLPPTALTPAAEVLRAALAEGRLSARGLRRVRTVARTIRDLDDGGDELRSADVLAALSLRMRLDGAGGLVHG